MQGHTQGMKELLNCFEYIKCYHADMLDSIAIMLEMFWLKRHSPAFIESLITLATKRKPIYDECADTLKNGLGEDLYIPPNPHSNLLKILKVIFANDASNRTIEEFTYHYTKKDYAQAILLFYTT